MSYDTDLSPDVLNEGRWVLDKQTRVMRWVPWVPPPLEEAMEETQRHLHSAPDRLFDLTRLVALLAAAPSIQRDKPRKPEQPFTLSDEERRAAHSRYVQGDRSAKVRLGEREYKRANQRAVRAARGAMYGEAS